MDDDQAIFNFDKYFNTNTSKPTPQWKHRNIVIYLTLIFCAFLVLWIVIANHDSRTNETVVLAAFGLSASTIGFYLTGSTWSDVKMKQIEAVTSTRPLRRGERLSVNPNAPQPQGTDDDSDSDSDDTDSSNTPSPQTNNTTVVVQQTPVPTPDSTDSGQ